MVYIWIILVIINTTIFECGRLIVDGDTNKGKKITTASITFILFFTLNSLLGKELTEWFITILNNIIYAIENLPFELKLFTTLNIYLFRGIITNAKTSIKISAVIIGILLSIYSINILIFKHVSEIKPIALLQFAIKFLILNL